MSYCYVKRASYMILCHKAVLVKNTYIVTCLCLNTKTPGKRDDETLMENVCEWRISLYIFSLCLSIFYDFSTMNMYYQELGAGGVGNRGRECSLGLRCVVSGPTLTVAKMVKASGSSTRSSLFSVPSTKQDTASSSARFFFKVVMVVMTVCRRTPGVTPDPHTTFPPLTPKTPQEGRNRRKSIREAKEDLCTKLFIAINLTF